MKKTYIAPMTEITSVNISSCLMQASITGVSFGSGFTNTDIIGSGTTTEADSRSSVWDDDDDF